MAPIDPLIPDEQMRQAAFSMVRRRAELRGELTSQDLQAGFQFGGQRFPLVNPGKRLAHGTPLDSRSPAAKPEWAIWVATMAESKETFEEFAAPIHRYVDETPNRVPLADIYFAHTGRRRANQARSVVGGFDMKLLAERLKSG